jgi:DNA-nicking Smr family endonuclease
MDFGDILEEWNKIKGEGGEPEADSREGDRGDDPAGRAEDRAREARHFASKKPQAVLDLHGMTEEEAESAIARFVESSAREGLEKVLVIHGKGLHSEGGRSVLKSAARRALEAHPLAGRMGEAARDQGGSGALWVAIRKKG